MSLQPGQIYLAEFGGSANRPVVVVSREELNRGTYVVVIPFTSTRYQERSQMPSCVPFKAGDFGLTKDCVAQAEAISFVEISTLDLDTGPIGQLDDVASRSLVKAIGYTVCSECEPE
jgi:mRNA-degrading endonuclease toxin of MazEF toxin-antitoxin module